MVIDFFFRRLFNALRIRLLLLYAYNPFTLRGCFPPVRGLAEGATTDAVVSRIPRIIHIVWVGDPLKAPLSLIDSWAIHNPAFDVVLWGNAELHSRKWFNQDLIDHFGRIGRYESVADLMRYEILFFCGGFAVDADSLCLQSLPDSMFSGEAFACYENEFCVPGLVSNGYLASRPGSHLLRSIVENISTHRFVKSLPGWLVLGPGRLTYAIRSSRAQPFMIYPSHYFIPEHYSGRRYQGPPCEVYARQYWGTTNSVY